MVNMGKNYKYHFKEKEHSHNEKHNKTVVVAYNNIILNFICWDSSPKTFIYLFILIDKDKLYK